MATNKKISDLSTVPLVDGSEAFPVAKGGLNYKVLISQIRDWIGLASSTNDGMMTKTDKLKLSNIATEATKNATDAQLRDRATHTGTQSVNTLSDVATVAKTGAYADLSGKPNLSPASLGAAPAAHVGSGGTAAHPIATDTTPGFMSATHFAKVDRLANVAVSGHYSDMVEAPFLQYGSHAGFSWYPDSNELKGNTINDYNSFGTGAYVPLAATGTTFDAASEYHSFISAASTYGIAGVRSAQPPVKRGNNALQGGFVFEGVVGLKWSAGGNMVFGLAATLDQAYGNWSGADEGIVIGWNGSSLGTSKLSVMVGNGTETNIYPHAEAGGTLADNMTVFFRVRMPAGATEATVTVRNLHTGVLLFDNVAIPVSLLPQPDTLLYCVAEAGTLATTTPAEMRLFNMSARRWQTF